MGLAVSILSYAGQVQVGILADEGLVPDPEAIVSAFHAEGEALLDRALEAEERASAERGPAPADSIPATAETVGAHDAVEEPTSRPEDTPPETEVPSD